MRHKIDAMVQKGVPSSSPFLEICPTITALCNTQANYTGKKCTSHPENQLLTKISAVVPTERCSLKSNVAAALLPWAAGLAVNCNVCRRLLPASTFFHSIRPAHHRIRTDVLEFTPLCGDTPVKSATFHSSILPPRRSATLANPARTTAV